MEPILQIQNLTMNFGGIRALDSLDMAVNPGEILALIGPNGAGKTTCFNCITGLYAPTRGDIRICFPNRKKESITGLKPNCITEKGMARTFQNIRLFPNMTVLENVLIGRHCKMRSGIIGAILKNRSTVEEEKQAAEKSLAILQFVGLADAADEPAKNLPYGARRLLEIARALATDPCLLLLDEPAAGMNIRETRDLDQLIVSIRDKLKISVLLIEHDMRLVMRISDRIVVMDYGKKIAEGPPSFIRSHPAVIRAYLGEDRHA
jgi:branched-chain amino acid transport system ATP-binding protein